MLLLSRFCSTPYHLSMRIYALLKFLVGYLNSKIILIKFQLVLHGDPNLDSCFVSRVTWDVSQGLETMVPYGK